MVSPVRVRATAALKRKVSQARSISTRAVAMGLAASWAMRRAKLLPPLGQANGGAVEHGRPLGGRERLAVATGDRGRHGRIEMGLGPHRHAAHLVAVVRGGHDGDLVGEDEVGADAHGGHVGHGTHLPRTDRERVSRLGPQPSGRRKYREAWATVRSITGWSIPTESAAAAAAATSLRASSAKWRLAPSIFGSTSSP